MLEIDLTVIKKCPLQDDHFRVGRNPTPGSTLLSPCANTYQSINTETTILLVER